jgi:hypothetical protein
MSQGPINPRSTLSVNQIELLQSILIEARITNELLQQMLAEQKTLNVYQFNLPYLLNESMGNPESDNPENYRHLFLSDDQP